MPPLKQMLGTGIEGFAPPDPSTPPISVTQKFTVGNNPYIRTSLPPFNAGPDTLRQFIENGTTPTRRVIPLPISTSSGGNTTVVNNTTVIQQGGSSSGGGGGGTTVVVTPSQLKSASVSITTPSLLPGATFTSVVQMQKSFQLLSMTASQPVEIRLYGDLLTQNADLVRITDHAVPFEVVSGLITDVVFDSPPFQWNWQNRCGANADSVISTNVYVTVINPSQVTGLLATTVGITYLPLENV